MKVKLLTEINIDGSTYKKGDSINVENEKGNVWINKGWATKEQKEKKETKELKTGKETK